MFLSKIVFVLGCKGNTTCFVSLILCSPSNIDFKLSTRNMKTEKIEKSLSAYSQMKYDGDLYDIVNTTLKTGYVRIDNSKLNGIGYFEKVSTCDDNCEECRFCIKLAEKAVKFNKEFT